MVQIKLLLAQQAQTAQSELFGLPDWVFHGNPYHEYMLPTEGSDGQDLRRVLFHGQYCCTRLGLA